MCGRPNWETISAATPAAFGVAIDVPCSQAYVAQPPPGRQSSSLSDGSTEPIASAGQAPRTRPPPLTPAGAGWKAPVASGRGGVDLFRPVVRVVGLAVERTRRGDADDARQVDRELDELRERGDAEVEVVVPDGGDREDASRARVLDGAPQQLVVGLVRLRSTYAPRLSDATSTCWSAA